MWLQLLCARLKELGSEYGALLSHGQLWGVRLLVITGTCTEMRRANERERQRDKDNTEEETIAQRLISIIWLK
jgi:uncharacterized ferritin-like protein (DUF455 family)